MQKGNCLIYNISLITICFLLLAVFSISCYFYFAKHQLNKKIFITILQQQQKLKSNCY